MVDSEGRVKTFLVILFMTLSVPATAQTLNPCILQVASSSPLICDDFDAPDGTLLNLRVAPSGNSKWSSAPTTMAVIVGKEVNNIGNSYNDLPNTLTTGGVPYPINYFGAAFRFLVANAGEPTTLIADNVSGAGSFVNFVHFNFGRTHGELTYGTSFTLLAQFFYAPLSVGSVYSVAMEFDQIGHRMKMHLPDGTVSGWMSIPSTTIPTIMRIQLGAFSPPGSATWTGIWGGQSKAETYAAAGKAAPMADVSYLKGLHNRKVGQVYANPSSAALLGTYTTPNSQSGDRLTVKITSSDDSAALPSVSLDIKDYEIPVYSNASVSVLGAPLLIRQNPQYTLGVCFGDTVTASLSGQVVSIYDTPAMLGCANDGYVSRIRINYSIEADGDPNGMLQ